MNMQKLRNQDQVQTQAIEGMQRVAIVTNDYRDNSDIGDTCSSSYVNTNSNNDHDADQSVDHAANDGDPSSAFSNKTFPEILAEILSTPRNQTSIAWLPHGKAFMILDRDLFVTDILPNYLGKSTKYTSFTRKLSRWKFQRVQCGPEEGAWIHENFTRDDLSAMTQMKCAKRKKPTKRVKDYPRSIPLKKRPVDANLFSSKSSMNNDSLEMADWDDQLKMQHQQLLTFIHPPQQKVQQQQQQSPMQQTSVDSTTESIVSAAVKVLLQGDPSPNNALSQQQQQRRPRQHPFPNNYNHGSPSNSLDLLQVLQHARTVPLNGPSDTMTALRLQHYIHQQQQQQHQHPGQRR